MADLVECDCPKSRVVHIRRKRGGDGQRAECASDEALFACLVRDAISYFPGEPSRSQVHLVRGLAQICVANHSLKKFWILPTILRRAGKEELVETDGGGAERVGLNYVGPSPEIFFMHLLNQVRLGQQKELYPAFEIFAFPIPKTLAAKIRFGQTKPLQSGSHGAIEDHDAASQQRFEGMERICHVE